MKKCPYCVERIKEDAVKCRYCGEWIKKKEDNFETKYDVKNIEKTQTTDKLDTFCGEIEKETGESNTLSSLVKDCFKQLRKVTIIFYVVVITLMFGVDLFNKDLMPIVGLGFVIMMFYFWNSMWPCARLVGRSPISWVFISMFLPFLGPVLVYDYLKCSAISQGLIEKRTIIKRIKEIIAKTKGKTRHT